MLWQFGLQFRVEFFNNKRKLCPFFIDLFFFEKFQFFSKAKVWPQKFKKKNSKRIQEIQFFFLKISVFPGKNLGFSEKKKIGKVGLFQPDFLSKFGLFSARDSSVFLPFQNSVGWLNAVQCSTRVQSKRCPMFHARPMEQANGGNGPPWRCPWLRHPFSRLVATAGELLHTP